MGWGRELGLFAATLAVLVGGFFAESLFGGKILSSADVLLASASFRERAPANFEPPLASGGATGCPSSTGKYRGVP